MNDTEWEQLEQLVHDIRSYQTCEYVHPLTCGTDSNHQPLVPFIYEAEVKLLCVDCGDVTYPPKVNFRELRNNVSTAFNPR
jgi:hypothetical protein